MVALVAACLIWIDRQHSFDIDTEAITFTHKGDEISGTLALPRDGGPHGLVVFIHGDGPSDADHDGGYLPLWESFARAGYASLSWDKPGVGKSEGDWLSYSMSDRADLALAAIDAVDDRPDIDSDRVGLWGASQAGWVMPKIANQRPETRFIIAVAPAINWQDQGRFNLLAELEAEGASEEQIEEAVDFSDAVRSLLRRGATYDEYLVFAEDKSRNAGRRGEPMSERHWAFVLANYQSDARADLGALSKIPVLLQVGGEDRNVDVAETEQVYRELLGDSVELRRYPDADHSIVRAGLMEQDVPFTLTWLFAPTRVFADGYLEDAETFLDSLEATAGQRSGSADRAEAASDGMPNSRPARQDQPSDGGAAGSVSSNWTLPATNSQPRGDTR